MDDQEEVVVIELEVDGTKLEYILTDVLEIGERRYATLYCDADGLEDEDRTLFAKINDVEGEDRFDVLSQSDELEMVLANTTVNVLDDLLLMTRARIFAAWGTLRSIDGNAIVETERSKLALLHDQLSDVLSLLNADTQEEDSEDSEDADE